MRAENVSLQPAALVIWEYCLSPRAGWAGLSRVSNLPAAPQDNHPRRSQTVS